MADPAQPSWLAQHASELIAYVIGASGALWKLFDLRAAAKKEDLEETAVLSLEWRALRGELRAEIEVLRQRTKDQETAIDAQRQRIYELTAANSELARKNKEQLEEIERLEGMLARMGRNPSNPNLEVPA